MTLEIKKPELEALIEELRKSGANLDEVLFNKLNAPSPAPQKSDPKLLSRSLAAQRMSEFSKTHSVKLPPGETVEQLVRDSHRY